MTAGKYFSDILKVAKSIVVGMGITLKYFLNYKKNTITIQYPRERDLIPPRHRGIHYLETEKCVMCWKCSDICPVDCIYIEGVRGADGVLEGGYRGQKATLSKFTVDYTVCIFCGLCEEPCPPKCIFLGPQFDYNATDRTMMEKNLLTDEVYTDEDEKFVQWARGENERLVAEKKKQAEAEKAKAAAARAEKAATGIPPATAPAPPAASKAGASPEPAPGGGT
jgi:formate hydrogenlyase subunit 6/NADH:ubiquinone oxidoreductase subunit I